LLHLSRRLINLKSVYGLYVDMKNIFFVGTAGCGKSTLVAAYKNWLDEQGFDALLLNLDPGTDILPYDPDVDIREWVSTAEVMEEYGLGPNGAQIVAADLMAMNISKMTDVVNAMRSDYLLIDTPGQLELFAFRESSKMTVEAFGKESSMLLYLSDPALCKDPNGFVTSMTLSALVQFRLQLPTFGLLSKSDILSDEERDRMLGWFTDPDSLFYDLMEHDSDPQTVVGAELFKAMDSMGVFGEVRGVSAKESTGMAEIYAASQLCFYGGEDAEPGEIDD
jgi:GTPase SAR1 family protein